MKPEYQIELVNKRTWYGRRRYWWRLRHMNTNIVQCSQVYRGGKKARDDSAKHLSTVTGFPVVTVDL